MVSGVISSLEVKLPVKHTVLRVMLVDIPQDIYEFHGKIYTNELLPCSLNSRLTYIKELYDQLCQSCTKLRSGLNRQHT